MRSFQTGRVTRLRLAVIFTLALQGSCLGPTTGQGAELLVCLGECPASAVGGVEYSRIQQDTTATQQLEFQNRGGATLHVASLDLETPDEEFVLELDSSALEGNCGRPPFDIAPRDDCKIIVSYTPRDCGTDENYLEISSNDISTPERRVRLFSSDIGPRIVFSPASVDFGLVANQAGPVTVRVTNVGTEPADITEVKTDFSNEFAILSGDEGTPIPLAPGDSFEVVVQYTADVGNGSGEGFLIATASAPKCKAVPGGRAALKGPPIAVCSDRTGAPFEPSQMSAAASRAPANTICRHSWQVSGTKNSNSVASFNAGAEQVIESVGGESRSCPAGQNSVQRPCFLPDFPGTYTFSLEVTDCRPNCPLLGVGGGCSGDDECCSFDCDSGGGCQESADGICSAEGCDIRSKNDMTCDFRVRPDKSFFVSLTWDESAGDDRHDFDLYMLRCAPQDARWTREDDAVYHSNRDPDWCSDRTTNGQVCTIDPDCVQQGFEDCTGSNDGSGRICADTTDDPELLIDATGGPGPEIIEIDFPCADTYVVGVHYFESSGPALTATVQVFVDGDLITDDSLSLPLNPRDFWHVGHVVLDDSLLNAEFIVAEQGDENPKSGVTTTTLPALPSPCPVGEGSESEPEL